MSIHFSKYLNFSSYLKLARTFMLLWNRFVYYTHSFMMHKKISYRFRETKHKHFLYNKNDDT
jgi:hypothetical protein